LTETGTAVEQYRAYRNSVQGGNYVSKTYTIDELADQFGFGIKNHPSAIKNFLICKAAIFNQPKFVCCLVKQLVTRNIVKMKMLFYADQLNLVPTFGWPASDVLLASDNFDPIAATAIRKIIRHQ
jgi:Na+/glutamate symporter